MPEIAKITYGQTHASVRTDELGMRQMQRKVYNQRDKQYILLKAPPASGKSRAFMFIALDKLINQGLKKVIIAVPETSIGASFKATNLTKGGFFSDWAISDRFNLCTPGSDGNSGKIKAFRDFMEQDVDRILLCTHATLRFAYDGLKDSDFDGVFLGIDEFHHASADTENSRLGDLVKGILENSTAHVMAMTGSYFRGDGVAVLAPEVEHRFTAVTYSYYDQLSGYDYLHAITLSYEFYNGQYFDMLGKSLDTGRKTIIHIPNVASIESTKQKYEEVDRIIDLIGDVEGVEKDTGVLVVKPRNGGRSLRIVDLVDDTPDNRKKRQAYLHRHASQRDAVDIIIALNMAKEGFDWPACEQMLTVGYRGSLTEIVQIIGRCTRDYPGKSEAFFTNIIAEPDATQKDVVNAVNDLLKAITASLLMEQVLAPKWDFKKKAPKLQILEPKSEVGKRAVRPEEMENLISQIMTDPEVMEAIPKKGAARLINKGLVPRIIMEVYPDLPKEDLEAVRQNVVTQMVLNSSNEASDGEARDNPDTRFLHFADGMCLDIKELNINLIDSVNPMEKAYQVLSKDIDRPTLAAIMDAINQKKGRVKEFSQEELEIYWPQVNAFFEEKGRIPDRHADDPYEGKLGEVLYWVKRQQQKAHGAGQRGER